MQIAFHHSYYDDRKGDYKRQYDHDLFLLPSGLIAVPALMQITRFYHQLVKACDSHIAARNLRDDGRQIPHLCLRESGRVKCASEYTVLDK